MRRQKVTTMKLLKFNNLFFYFMATQLVFFITPYFAAPPLEIDLDLSRAYIVQGMALACFTFGYALNALLNGCVINGSSRRKNKRPSRPGDAPQTSEAQTQIQKQSEPSSHHEKTATSWTFAPEFFTSAYFLMIAGAIIVVIQVAIFQSPIAYLKQLFSGDFDSNIRNAFLATSSEGSLSGVLKMFGAVPLSVYLLSLSLPHFLEMSQADRAQFERLNKAALFATAVKVLFSLDRLTIMAMVIANVFITIRTRKNLPVKGALVLVFLLLVNFVSGRRVAGQNGGGFVVLYYNLGLVNLELLVETLRGYTYGFSSILSPLTFVAKYLGMSPDIGLTINYDFRYVAAQSLMGYVYQDFGPLFPLFFLLMGSLYKTIDRRALRQRNIYFVSIYFLVLAVTITYVAVPGFKSVDFWLALLVPLFLVRLFARKRKRRAVPRQLDMPFVEIAPALTAAT